MLCYFISIFFSAYFHMKLNAVATTFILLYEQMWGGFLLNC